MNFFDGLLYESHNRAKLIDHNWQHSNVIRSTIAVLWNFLRIFKKP